MATSSQHDQSPPRTPSSSSSMPSSSQHKQANIITPNRKDKDPKHYIPLYRASLEGDWKRAKDFFDTDPDAKVARISTSFKTALQVAAMSGHADFVEELVKLMPKEALELKDSAGFTALHSVTTSGNTKAAMAMVNVNPDLPQIPNNGGETPIFRVAKLGHKELLSYLCLVTKDEDSPKSNSPFRRNEGAELIVAVIAADFYDVALYLVKQYPLLAITKDQRNHSALYALARKSSAFKSGSRLRFWQRCIYSCITITQAPIINHQGRGDAENPLLCSSDCIHMTQIGQVFQRLNGLFWNAIKQIVPSIRHVYDTKVMHTQALELLKCICEQVSLLETQLEIAKLLNFPTLVAAEYGNVELITTSVETEPNQIWTKYNKTSHSILHVAIIHRQEKVFNLMRDMGTVNSVLASSTDDKGNTILHLAAKLAPPSKLKAVSGAALQVQRELQWFQAVEKLVQPTYREMENLERKSPRELFTEEHEQLIEKGEKWMKDMATSSMVVATLIATVAFTAAFTVPGGNNGESGTPIFLKSKWFMVFAISNALGFFSSLTSVLIFVAILTSRYAEEDFLKSLPQKLILGLTMLFFSIAAMLATSSATYFIMFGHRFASISLLLSFLACIPVTVFALLQLPLFVEVIRSTYGSDIFHR